MAKPTATHALRKPSPRESIVLSYLRQRVLSTETCLTKSSDMCHIFTVHLQLRQFSLVHLYPRHLKEFRSSDVPRSNVQFISYLSVTTACGMAWRLQLVARAGSKQQLFRVFSRFFRLGSLRSGSFRRNTLLFSHASTTITRPLPMCRSWISTPIHILDLYPPTLSNRRKTFQRMKRRWRMCTRDWSKCLCLRGFT